MYFSDSSLQFVSRNLPRVFERVQIDFAFMFTDPYIYIICFNICIYIYTYIHIRVHTLLSAMLLRARRSGFSHSHVNLEGFVTLSSLCPDVSTPPATL